MGSLIGFLTDLTSGKFIEVSPTNPLPVTSAAPAGSATSAKQDTGNTSLSNIDSKLTTVFSTVNSTTTPLGIGGVFTGTSEDIGKYAEIRVTIFADQVSATDGLSFQQSPDGTNWDTVDAYTIPASTGKTFGVGAVGKFFRVVYTNGGVAQGAFRLSTKLNITITKPSSVRASDARSNENDFEEVAAYLQGYNGTSWDRLRSTTANGLATDITRIIPGVTATSLGKAEDAVAASGDTGVATFGVAFAGPTLASSVSAGGDYTSFATDLAGVQYTRLRPLSTFRQTADGQVKSGAGYIHTITIATTTATPVAGLLTVYDSLTETGTVLLSVWVLTSMLPTTLTLDIATATGIFIGFDATLAGINVVTSYI